jgi:rhodanese-related sulfurtransferase
MSHNREVPASVKRRTLDDLLAEAESRIARFSPADAHAALQADALLIDIRSDGDRERDGIVPGSLHIPRTVLEWRTAPNSGFRNPHVGDLDREVILLCDHGYSSILAAAVLEELGFMRAGDVIGGFVAWRDAGLPVSRARSQRRGPDERAGMGPPDP